MAEQQRQHTKESQYAETANVRSLAEASLLNLPNVLKKIGDAVACLVEGSPDPEPMVERPKFSVRAWQVFPKVQATEAPKSGTLHLIVDGLTGTWYVEIAFEGEDEREDGRKREKPKDNPQPLKGNELQFALPEEWVEEQGSRFVTVYFRDTPPPPPGQETKETKKTEEKPTTIIRIIPAALSKAAAQDDDDDDIEAEDADD